MGRPQPPAPRPRQSRAVHSLTSPPPTAGLQCPGNLGTDSGLYKPGRGLAALPARSRWDTPPCKGSPEAGPTGRGCALTSQVGSGRSPFSIWALPKAVTITPCAWAPRTKGLFALACRLAIPRLSKCDFSTSKQEHLPKRGHALGAHFKSKEG